VSVTSTAGAFSSFEYGAVTTDAIAQGSSGQAFDPDENTGDEPDAFSTALPDKAYATTLIDGASNVADALLGPGDKIFATAILKNLDDNGASSTFDFQYRGDLLLGLVDGLGAFSIDNGVFENFVDDSVINLGNLGPNVDLTVSVVGSGVFVVGGAVPEASTWVMMLVGFVGLGFAGYRRARAGDATARSIG
jgi:PEP-CTERM motif